MIKVYSNAVCIPDQILWMVYNDVDANDTMGSGSYALRFEIQLTAFAFHCQENTFLNNTIFNKYKIINRAVSAADSVFLVCGQIMILVVRMMILWVPIVQGVRSLFIMLIKLMVMIKGIALQVSTKLTMTFLLFRA